MKIQDKITEVNQRRIKSFLNNELKEYAQYVLRTRTMPSIMDGLRVGARKILWAAQTGDLSKKKFVKMPSILGDTMKLQYAHGDASLATTTVGLCCTHLNKFAPLEAIGQIPSLRVPKCDTATRYLMIKKSPFLEFYNFDKELLNIQTEEGEKIEPKYFLPIIPLVLLNRTSSPGFGFSFKSFSYSIDDIIDNTLKSVLFGSCIDSNQLTPEIVGIKQENIIYNSNKNQWYNVGDYSFDFDNDIFRILDLPFNVSFESFEELLQNLKEKFVIDNWMNMSEQGMIKYVVKFPKGRLRLLLNNNKWKFFKMFNLYTNIPKDILNCMDEDGKTILFFESPYELIDCFVKKRLRFYQERKGRTIKELQEKLDEYQNKINFINKVISGEIIVVKRKLNDIKQDLIKHNIKPYVLDMKIWNLTSEEIEKLNALYNKTSNQLEYIKNRTIQEMYVDDLIDFKQKYSNILEPTLN